MSAGADAIALTAADDVATALRPLSAGEEAVVDLAGGEVRVVVREPIPLCHKFALHDLAGGAPVRKYGHPIGEATTHIPAGAHVHVHNLRSRRARRSGQKRDEGEEA